MTPRTMIAGLFVMFAVSAADAAEPLVRIVMPPGSPYLAGQRIDVEVQVLVPNYFMSPPQFPSLDIPGAVVTLSDDTALNFSETIVGETFSGIRKRYLVVPMAEGQFSLPDAHITFAYAAVPGQATRASVRFPPQTFQAVLPPGAAGPNGPLPLAPLQITQAWEPASDTFKVGDAVTRTINVFAPGMQAMLIPPPNLVVPEQVKAYPRDPVLSTQTKNGRDFEGGRRVDRVTYQFARAGEYEFLAVANDWYDVTSGKVQTATVPGRRFTVAAGSVPTSEIPPEHGDARSAFDVTKWSFWLTRGLAASFAVGALGILYFTLLPRLTVFIASRRKAYEQSERAFFNNFRMSCRAGDLLAIYQALSAWAVIARIGPIAEWTRMFGGPDLAGEIDRLNSELFSRRPSVSRWSADKLEAGMVDARRNARWVRKGDRRHALPRLNPDWITDPAKRQISHDTEVLR